MIELRNLTRDPSAHHPDLAHFADLVIHAPRRDIFQEECCLGPTVRRLLSTLLWEHRGENGANDNALLVGECGVPGCCGVDFSVLPKGDAVELGWADPDELGSAVERASREHPDKPVFPNEFRVAKVTVEVPRARYAAAVLRLALWYLRRRGRDSSPDPKTEEMLGWCEDRYPDVVRSVRSWASEGDPVPLEDPNWTPL